jgi:hypothetical protein
MLRPLLCSLLCVLFLTLYATAKNPEQTQFNRDIRIDAGQKVGDVTCINCSVYIAGESSGEVTTIHGNIVLEAGGSVAGEVTAVWGNVHVQSGSNIAGEVTAVAGAVRRSPGSSIAGDVTSLEGTVWVLAIMLPPIFGLGLIAALVTWIVHRRRSRAAVPQQAYC